MTMPLPALHISGCGATTGGACGCALIAIDEDPSDAPTKSAAHGPDTRGLADLRARLAESLHEIDATIEIASACRAEEHGT